MRTDAHGRHASRDPRAPVRAVLFEDLDAISEEQLLWIDSRDERHGVAREIDVDVAVRRAVRDALSAKQREVVEACFFLGLSQGEIARRLGVSQQVVHKRLYGVEVGGRRIGGAMRKLRVALEPFFGASRPSLP